MSQLASTIDTLFDAVIQLSMRIIALYYKDASTEALREPAPAEEPLAEEAPVSFRSLDDILRAQDRAKTEAVKNMVMYTRNLSVPVYRNPTVEFDSQLATIPYGEMVMMLEARGRFFRVMWNTTEGWVLKDDLSDRAAHVYPDFTIGVENPSDAPSTANVRAFIGDEFNVRQTGLPLQAGEYVLYRLFRKGKRIMWPHESRPRVPGLWHKLLRGVPGIHVGVVPKIDSVMEYMLDSDTGHLAYVEAIFPDDTITISEANYPDSGIYNERVLTKEEWRELRPTFIAVQ